MSVLEQLYSPAKGGDRSLGAMIAQPDRERAPSKRKPGLFGDSLRDPARLVSSASYETGEQRTLGLQPDDRVKLLGCRYVGKTGFLQTWDAKTERWRVKLDDTNTKPIWVKAGNIRKSNSSANRLRHVFLCNRTPEERAEHNYRRMHGQQHKRAPEARASIRDKWTRESECTAVSAIRDLSLCFLTRSRPRFCFFCTVYEMYEEAHGTTLSKEQEEMLASQLTAADAAQPDAIEKARKTMLREQREAAIAAKMKGSAFSASLTMATPPPSGRPRPSSKDRRRADLMARAGKGMLRAVY